MAAPVPTVAAPVPTVAAPLTDVAAPLTDVAAPLTDVAAPLTDVVAPLTDVAVPLPDVAAPLPDVATPLTDVVVAPVPDVIALVQVLLAQLQSDLASFLFGTGGVEPVVDALEGIHGAGLSAAADAWVASQLPRLLRPAGIFGAPSAGNAAGVTTLGGMAPATFCATTQVCRGSSLPGMAQSFRLPPANSCYRGH